MKKIDKSLYTKAEYKALKEQYKSQKTVNVSIPKLNNNKKTAFVVGNGTSRSRIDINQLQKHGVVYGCNALYRNHRPDYLIAVDVKMILEISKSQYHLHNTVWTNYNRSYENIKNLNYFKPSKGWSSGPTALWLATQHGYDAIYILGFDYQGLSDGRKFNNIYADSPNYKKSTDGATFHGNWLRQTKIVLQDNPKILFTRIVEPNTFVPDEFKKQKNLKTMAKQTFINLFN